MKTRIVDSVTPVAPEPQLTFPALFQSPGGDLVLATGPRSGVKLVSFSSEAPVGFQYGDQPFYSTWDNSAPFWKRVTEPTVVEFNAR